MVNERDLTGDLAVLAVPLVGRLVETGDPWGPYRLIGAAGVAVEPVSEFLPGVAGEGPVGGHYPLLWDGSASVVPVSVGIGGALGSGDEDRGPRLFALAPGHRAVTSTSLAAGRVFAGAGSARCRCGLRGFGARA